VYLVRKDVISPKMIDIEQIPLPLLRLITEAGDEPTTVEHMKTADVKLSHTVL